MINRLSTTREVFEQLTDRLYNFSKEYGVESQNVSGVYFYSCPVKTISYAVDADNVTQCFFLTLTSPVGTVAVAVEIGETDDKDLLGKLHFKPQEVKLIESMESET